MKEQEMRAHLKAMAGNVSVEDFAEHIIRNYSIERRLELGDTLIQQAYTVLVGNIKRYSDKQ